MTNAPIRDEEPRDIENMLADAERNIHAIRAELAERRAERRHEQIEELPDDISTFEGSWRSIIKILRDVIREEREARAAAKDGT